MSTAVAPAATLITIAPSHFCEKARWALDRCGLPYREEAHAPLMHTPFALSAGGRRTVPVLKAAGRTVNDSTDILRFCDSYLPAERRLFPEDPALLGEVVALEERFDRELGPHTRRLPYYHLLPHRELVVGGFRGKVPGWELGLLSTFYPAVAWLMRRGMRIDTAGANRSLNHITNQLLEVGQRLQDGRRYLVGGRFTAADLTFAALMGTVLWPAEYGVPLPPLEGLPPAFKQQVLAWRQTPAGQFALRLYAEERRARG